MTIRGKDGARDGRREGHRRRDGEAARREGATVVVADFDESAAQETATAIGGTPFAAT